MPQQHDPLISQIWQMPLRDVGRYHRIGLTFVKSQSPTNVQKTRDFPISKIPNAVAVKSHSPAIRYPAVGECIYCGAKELRPNSSLPLGEEHIVAEGLGGILVLPEASCEECAAKTCWVENQILRKSLFAPRAKVRVRRKPRKRREESYIAETEVNGKAVEIRLPLGEHPTLLCLSILMRPRLISGERKPWDNIHGSQVIDLFEGSSNRFDGRAVYVWFDTVVFSQMLAKIAHGFAIATVGLNKFKPLLTAFILRRFGKDESYVECFNWVGGDPCSYAPSDELHTLGHEYVSFNGRNYLMVTIRLFGNLGMPVYKVIVGEVWEIPNDQVTFQEQLPGAHPKELPLKLPQSVPRNFLFRWIEALHYEVELLWHRVRDFIRSNID